MTTDDGIDDAWVKSAMDDTDLVVHLLFKLRHSSSPHSPPKTWTVRQPRSKQQPPPTAKKSPSTRASPTTPLSWSAATSASSGGGRGGEESSRPSHYGLHDGRRDGLYDGSGGSRSKVIGPNETTPTKRPRKKKTLAELKEDEAKLLKERKQLKRELESLQATCEKQRKDNESLKKMKNDMRSHLLAGSEVKDCMEEKETGGFALPDLNLPVDEDY